MHATELTNALHFLVSGPAVSHRPTSGGPLKGLTFVAKDVFDVEGEATFAGCDRPLIAIALETAPAVQAMLNAGARYLGKTQMVQLAFGGWGSNACVGPPRNPWDARNFRLAGGSSSGSAVAVAAGFADIALGSDTGGSIRIPASFCGVVGLKPSRGKISVQGVMPLSPSLDTIGPMARSVSLVNRAYAILSNTAPVNAPAKLGNLVIRRLIGDDLDATSEVAAAYDIAVECMSKAGAEAVALRLPTPPGSYVSPSGKILGFEAWREYGEKLQHVRDSADPGVLMRMEAVAGLTQSDYIAAKALRHEHQAQFLDWFVGADFLVMPTTASTAPRFEEVDESDFSAARFTRMANYLDLCAISIPCGLDEAGFPIGLQILGRPGDESRLIAAALAIEKTLAFNAKPFLHFSNCKD